MASWTDPTPTDPAGGNRDVGADVAVVVPVHNEAARIARCLESMRASVVHLQEALRDPPAVRLILVLDSCTDGTARAVAAVPQVETVQVQYRRVGSARRAGAEHALATPSRPVWWLASTDADSAVPAHWLTTMVGLSRGGADLVLGTVRPDADLPLDRWLRWQQSYRGTDGHRHVHGANLGISARAYRILGGWPDVRCHEDVALARRAAEAGMSIVRTGAIAVRTSGRLAGRAPGGFATYLAALTPSERPRRG